MLVIAMNMGHDVDFQLVSLSAVFGVQLTIFFKKDFTFRIHVGSYPWIITSLAILWMLSLFGGNTWLVSALTILYATKNIRGLAREEKIKSISLALTIFIDFKLSGDHLACLTVISAITQLLRCPRWLKIYLREFRIIFGPVYTLLAIGAAFQSGFNYKVMMTSALMASVASVLLRPDNLEALRFLITTVGFPTPSTEYRKYAHGFLMFLSLVCAMVHLILSDVHRIFLFVTFTVGALNILLYIFIADFPRKISHAGQRI